MLFQSELAYKAVRHGAQTSEVNERFATQTCPNCGITPNSRPKGIAGLGIRERTAAIAMQYMVVILMLP